MSVDFLSKNFPPFQVHHAKKPPRFYPDGFQRNVIDFYLFFRIVGSEKPYICSFPILYGPYEHLLHIRRSKKQRLWSIITPKDATMPGLPKPWGMRIGTGCVNRCWNPDRRRDSLVSPSFAGECTDEMKRTAEPLSKAALEALRVKNAALAEAVAALRRRDMKLERTRHRLELEENVLKKANEILKKEGVNPNNPINQEKAVVIDALRNAYRLKELLDCPNISKSSCFYQKTVLDRPNQYQVCTRRSGRPLRL